MLEPPKPHHPFTRNRIRITIKRLLNPGIQIRGYLFCQSMSGDFSQCNVISHERTIQLPEGKKLNLNGILRAEGNFHWTLKILIFASLSWLALFYWKSCLQKYISKLYWHKPKRLNINDFSMMWALTCTERTKQRLIKETMVQVRPSTSGFGSKSWSRPGSKS
jgi:hypothetical protein